MAIQGVVSLCVRVLKNIRTCLKSSTENSSNEKDENNERKDLWTSEELERLLQFVAKVFMLQFPLYAGPKSAGLRNEEVSAAEATQMAVYCDVHDSTGIHIFFYENQLPSRGSTKYLCGFLGQWDIVLLDLTSINFTNCF